MPVVTTVTYDAPSMVTTTIYRVDVVIDRMKTAPRIHPTQANGLAPSFDWQVRGDQLIPNASPSGAILRKAMSGNDRIAAPQRIPIQTTLLAAAPGTIAGTNRIATFGQDPIQVGASERNSNVYYVDVPVLTGFIGVLEADLGYPYGTVHIIYIRGGSTYLSTSAPPSGWVRNPERLQGSGIANGYVYQCNALGDRFFSALLLAINVGDFGNRNAGWTTDNLPTFRLCRSATINSPLTGWNFQTGVVYRGNVTMRGRWRGVDHSDPVTYNPLPGAYLGSDFALGFTDTAPTSSNPQLQATFNQALGAPTLVPNQYNGLWFEVKCTSDWINASGVLQTSTSTDTYQLATGSQGIPLSNYSIPYIPPSYWFFDLVRKAHGPDDATVRWVAHAGYRPPLASVPPTVAQTNVAPILTRYGKLIILQGGYANWTGTLIQITASTPACTGLTYSTDPTLTNKSNITSSMSFRITSVQYPAQWSGSSSLQYLPEYSLPSGGSATGVYRQAYVRANVAGTFYEGPGITLTDICALVSTVNGASENIDITVSSDLTIFTGRYIRPYGMQGGGVSTPARGVIQLLGKPGHKENITIVTSTKTVVFQFDTAGTGVNAGRVQVLATSSSVDVINANLIAAINAAGLTITASVPVITDLMCEVTLRKTVSQSGGFRQSVDRWTVAVP